MADERRLQLVVDVDEDEETVRVLGLYNRFESLLILSYLKETTIQIPSICWFRFLRPAAVVALDRTPIGAAIH